jgi:hypothetical protein
MNKLAYEQEVLAKAIKGLRESAFALECVAHLRGREQELLPSAKKVREVIEELSK